VTDLTFYFDKWAGSLPHKARARDLAGALALVRRRFSWVQRLFIGIVLLPTLTTAVYFSLIASDRFVSEAQFIVRGVSHQDIGGLSSLLETFGISRAEDDTFAVQDFMQSRDAVQKLESKLPLRDIFSRPEADVFSRFSHSGGKRTFEALFKYYLRRVTVVRNTSTGISRLRVGAFRPQDAQLLAKTLLALSEELVNQMNARAQRDTLNSAVSEVDRAESQVMDAQAKITSFRNRELLIDPSSASTKVIELVGQLSADLAQTKTQLTEMRNSAPSNPSIPSLEVRAAALQDQIAAQRGKMTGSEDALSAKMSDYERLTLNREFADKNLTAALASMEMARQEARRQQIYIETIVAPNLPDESTEPGRIRMVLTVFVFSLAAFAMTWMLLAGAREHVHG
jgi:capsular polysaccharide transport system permease protein